MSDIREFLDKGLCTNNGVCNDCAGWDYEHKVCQPYTQYLIDKQGGATIKDSGERREFPSGATRDIQVGKGRYDLLPFEAIRRLAVHCEKGAIKYGERNCEKGIPTKSLLDSAIRHLCKYAEGYTDEPHLDAAMWNIAFIMHNDKYFPEGVEVNAKEK